MKLDLWTCLCNPLMCSLEQLDIRVASFQHVLQGEEDWSEESVVEVVLSMLCLDMWI